MNDAEKYRKEDARRLLCWIKENKNRWQDIVTAITESNASIKSELWDVVQSLHDNGFYQLLVLLFYSNNYKLREAMEDSLISAADVYWDDKLPDKVVELLLDNLGRPKETNS